MSNLRHAVALALLLVFAGSRPAFGFPPPFGSVADCGNPEIAAHMGDPAVFAGLDRCASLCKKAVSDCKKLTKRINGCLVSYYVTFYGWADRNCDELLSPGDRRSCKSSDADNLKATKTTLGATQQSYLLECDQWGVSCGIDCGP